MNTFHWGEEPVLGKRGFTPDVTADIERSMDKFSLAMYEFESDDENPSGTEEIILPPPDPMVTYAISLHKHVIDVTEMIRVAELAVELNLLSPEDAIPKIAPRPEIHPIHKPNNLNYIPKEFTPFSIGKEADVPELSEAVVKQILSKSVATLFAHIGYESTHQSLLDLMTDVLDEFFRKICHKLRVAVDDDEKKRGMGFPHVVERVLVETGLGGAQGLHDYYQNRVIKYVDVLLKRCREVDVHYKTLLVPKCPSPMGVFRVKVEEEDAVEDNPQVHFPTLEGDMGYPSLQTGYQLLNSLEAGEAEASLQALLEGEEDVMVSTSPSSSGVVSVQVEADLSHLPPYLNTKKRKTK